MTLSSAALIALLLLVFQTCGATWFLRYTRLRSDVPTASIGFVVLLQELTKCIASLGWCWLDAASEVALERSAAFVKDGEHDDACRIHSPPVGGGVGSTIQEQHHYDSSCSGVSTVHALPAFSQEEDARRVLAPPAEGAGRGERRCCLVVNMMTMQGSLVLPTFVGHLRYRGKWKLLAPALLFSVQNAAVFVAMTHLDPTMFMVVYQSKLLVTALLMMAILKRSFSRTQWIALGLLFFGILLTQMKSTQLPSLRPSTAAGGDVDPLQDPWIGVAAAVGAALSSALAGVLMEKLLKDDTGDDAALLSTKNVFLSAFSMVFVGCATVSSAVAADTAESLRSLMTGVDAVVWGMIVNQAVGGILVAITLRHADNVLKGFATTAAIVVGGIGSYAFFGTVPSPLFAVGSGVVCAAVVLYSSSGW